MVEHLQLNSHSKLQRPKGTAETFSERTLVALQRMVDSVFFPTKRGRRGLGNSMPLAWH